LHASPNIIRVITSRRMRWARHVARIGYIYIYIYIYTHTHIHTHIHTYIHTYILLVGKREGKRPLGRPRRRWEDSIRTDLREIAWKDVDWKHLTRDKNQWRTLVNTVMNLRVP
jgi:hypothetical protein